MTRNELTDRIGYAERDLAFLRQLKTNCTTCDHYQGGYCKKHQGNPPPDFAAVGCDDWNYDDVPF
jgi:hypothetical protein